MGRLATRWEREDEERKLEFYKWIYKASDEDLKHAWYTNEWRGRRLRIWMRDGLVREARTREREKQTVVWPHEAELRLYGLA